MMIDPETIPEKEQCPDCGGSGGSWETMGCDCCSDWFECLECEGTGRKREE